MLSTEAINSTTVTQWLPEKELSVFPVGPTISVSDSCPSRLLISFYLIENAFVSSLCLATEIEAKEFPYIAPHLNYNTLLHAQTRCNNYLFRGWHPDPKEE